MAPDTEFDLYFCAGIGPLQLGVVLVLYFVQYANRRHDIYTLKGPFIQWQTHHFGLCPLTCIYVGVPSTPVLLSKTVRCVLFG